MRLTVLPVEPVGTRNGYAMVKRRDGCSMEEVTIPVYPAEPRGEKLRRMRVGRSISLGAAARLLGLTASGLSAIEHGRATLSDADWSEAFRALESLEGR